MTGNARLHQVSRELAGDPQFDLNEYFRLVAGYYLEGQDEGALIIERIREDDPLLGHLTNGKLVCYRVSFRRL